MIIKKNFIMILSLLIIPLIGVLMLIPLGSSSYNYSGYIYATATPSTGTPNVYSEPNKGFLSPTSAAQEKELMKKNSTICIFIKLISFNLYVISI